MDDRIIELQKKRDELRSQINEINSRIREIEDEGKAYYIVRIEPEDYNQSSSFLLCGFCTKTEAEKYAKAKCEEWECGDIPETPHAVTKEQYDLAYDIMKANDAISAIEYFEWGRAKIMNAYSTKVQFQDFIRERIRKFEELDESDYWISEEIIAG